MIEELWLIPLGFVAGILGSIIGLGGGIIIVPVLTFMGFSPTLAVSNSLFAVFSNSVASTTMYAKQKRIELSLGWKLGLMAVPGTILGHSYLLRYLQIFSKFCLHWFLFLLHRTYFSRERSRKNQ